MIALSSAQLETLRELNTGRHVVIEPADYREATVGEIKVTIILAEEDTLQVEYVQANGLLVTEGVRA